MKIRVTIAFLIVAAILLSGPATGTAQTDDTSPNITQLRSDIKKLEFIENDPNVMSDVKEINHDFLIAKRAQLRSLLTKKRDGLRSYLSNAASALTAPEILRVETAISDVNLEIKALDDLSTQTASSTAPATSTDPATRLTHSQTTASVLKPSTTMTTAGTEPESVESVVAPVPSENSAPAPSSSPASNQDPQTPPAFTPTTTTEQFNKKLRQVAHLIVTTRKNAPGTPLATFEPRRDHMLLALGLALHESQANFVATAENARTDKQEGNNESSGGTTSLVSKGGVPAVFGLGVENGALTQTTNKTTTTFRFNPVGLIDAMAQRGYIDTYQAEDSFQRFLRNFALGVSFDTSRGDQPGVFTADKKQLSGYSIRYNLINKRDPRDKKYTQAWTNLVGQQAVAVVGDLATIFRESFVNAAPGSPLAKWIADTQSAVNALPATSSEEDVQGVLTAQLNKLPTDLPPEIETAVKSLAKDFESFLQARDDILRGVSNRLIATVEYSNERPLNLPSLSNFKFIAEKGTAGGGVDFTFNGALTFLNSLPAGPKVRRLRDFHFGLQGDVLFGKPLENGKFVLTFAGRFERLIDNQVMTNGTMIAPKGDILVGQAKLTIPIKGTAFKIPLSISYANRTEFLKEKEIRGNFGFTFDVDSIFAKLNPFSKK